MSIVDKLLNIFYYADEASFKYYIAIVFFFRFPLLFKERLRLYKNKCMVKIYTDN